MVWVGFQQQPLSVNCRLYVLEKMYHHAKIGPTQLWSGGTNFGCQKWSNSQESLPCTMQNIVAMPDKIWNLTFFYVHGSYIQCSNSTANYYDLRLQRDSHLPIQSLKLAVMAVSLGGVETLVEHPASTTHNDKCVPREVKIASGITDGLLRLRS